MAHTMTPKRYYRALQRGNDAYIDGHFYNGRFYEGNNLVGQIDDDGAFRYFESKDDGRPTFPEHIAGYVEGLVLTLKDGSIFDVIEVESKSSSTPKA
ncbi:hypothetical protein CXF97_24725 [Pseudomonas sp. Choline-02u-1]|nr:hypothetical protein CXF97_24725 [Pseudomonas sp. Choline-02u-1]